MSFATRSGILLERADVGYAEGTRRFNLAYAAPRYPLVPLAEVASLFQYGSSARAEASPDTGLPMLRMVNIREDQIDTSALKYVRLAPADAERYRLLPGDLLFNRTNSKELVGKCAVFGLPGNYVFASYLIRVRLDEAMVRPDFVAAFLATRAGRIQIDRVSRQIIGMANVNGQELRQLLIPLPTLDVQDELLAPIREAAKTVAAKRERARSLVALGGEHVQQRLRLVDVDRELPRSFAVRLGQLIGEVRLDAKAYRGGTGQAARGDLRTMPLGDVAQINPKTGDKPEAQNGLVPFVGLPDCEGTRVATVGAKPADEVRSAPVGHPGDILFAKIEPSIFNKKYVFVDGDAVRTPFRTSTEFFVLRARPEVVAPGYLWALLFTEFVYRQIEGQTTGSSGRRRLSADALAALALPIPPHEVQEQLAQELLARREEAQQHVEEADSLWREVKGQLQEALLGGDLA